MLSFKQKHRGRRVEPIAREEVAQVLLGMPLRRDLLIEYLHRIQDHYQVLSAVHLCALAEVLGLSPVEVYEVASFYHHFDVVKESESAPAALTVRVCRSLTCEMFAAADLEARLRRILGAHIRVQRVSCVGRCETAPVAVVGMRPVLQADAEQVKAVATAGSVQPTAEEATAQIDLGAYLKDGGYTLYQHFCTGKLTLEAILASLEHAGLRGLGGAGFPVARKWQIVRQQSTPRLMVVNIDEGEPGTFKDRVFLQQDPHRFLEGMLIAAHATAVDAVYLYLRDEYAACRALLAHELARLREETDVLALPVYLRRGAGAYICGEESALIESLEGKRGEPRLRPPYVAEKGLFGQPTLVHNLETLYQLRAILEDGGALFANSGRRGRKGLRSFSVSGRVNKPGVHVAPAGISVRELIDEYCDGMLHGHVFYGYFPGGASGGMLPASLGDVALDFDTLQEYGCFIGSAAIIVLSEQDRARDYALNAMRFFAHESCGQCTPCREGTTRAVALMEQDHWDVQQLQQLGQIMTDASICGLGQAAANPMLCALKYFPQELDDDKS